ncbi:hypothetical protein LXL04_003981 [Taraxacum kok-saghyz]
MEPYQSNKIVDAFTTSLSKSSSLSDALSKFCRFHLQVCGQIGNKIPSVHAFGTTIAIDSYKIGSVHAFGTTIAIDSYKIGSVAGKERLGCFVAADVLCAAKDPIQPVFSIPWAIWSEYAGEGAWIFMYNSHQGHFWNHAVFLGCRGHLLLLLIKKQSRYYAANQGWGWGPFV